MPQTISSPIEVSVTLRGDRTGRATIRIGDSNTLYEIKDLGNWTNAENIGALSEAKEAFKREMNIKSRKPGVFGFKDLKAALVQLRDDCSTYSRTSSGLNQIPDKTRLGKILSDIATVNNASDSIKSLEDGSGIPLDNGKNDVHKKVNELTTSLKKEVGTQDGNANEKTGEYATLPSRIGFGKNPQTITAFGKNNIPSVIELVNKAIIFQENKTQNSDSSPSMPESGNTNADTLSNTNDEVKISNQSSSSSSPAVEVSAITVPGNGSNNADDSANPSSSVTTVTNGPSNTSDNDDNAAKIAAGGTRRRKRKTKKTKRKTSRRY